MLPMIAVIETATMWSGGMRSGIWRRRCREGYALEMLARQMVHDGDAMQGHFDEERTISGFDRKQGRHRHALPDMRAPGLARWIMGKHVIAAARLCASAAAMQGEHGLDREIEPGALVRRPRRPLSSSQRGEESARATFNSSGHSRRRTRPAPPVPSGRRWSA